MHREFQHAGSDIVEAFTYNGHREKMRIIGKEELLEPLNRSALKIAKKVALETPKRHFNQGSRPNLMAGNISNSNIWKHMMIKNLTKVVESMFSEMIGWAVEEGADMLIGETFYYAEEAFKALEIMKKNRPSNSSDNFSNGREYNERWKVCSRHLQGVRTTWCRCSWFKLF